MSIIEQSWNCPKCGLVINKILTGQENNKIELSYNRSKDKVEIICGICKFKTTVTENTNCEQNDNGRSLLNG